MFPFLHDYPYSDLHEIDLAYLQMLIAALEGNDKTLLNWKATHEREYAELSRKVEGLINNLVDVIVPWDSSVAYHIFSIVEYQGTNYIAVQDVPVGTMITNTDYWQPANTIVEQINAIGTIASDLLKYSVNDDIGLIFPRLDGSYDPAGLCCAFYTGEGHATLIDLGRNEVFPTIKRALDAAGVRIIDNIFITHFHGDHTGEAYGTDYSAAYDNWKNNYDMQQTVFYLPPVASTYPSDAPAKIRASFPDNEIVTMIPGSGYNWHGVVFKPYNISTADFAYYDQETPNDYNAYSAIIYAEYGNSRFLCTGDINPTAQKRCMDMGYLQHSNIITIPHHGVNSDTDPDYINILSPEYTYIPTGSDTNRVGLQGTDIYVASLYGKIYTNTVENEYGTTFIFGKYGVSAAGDPELITGYNISHSFRNVYVNEAYSGDIQDGSPIHPYNNMRRAVNSMKGITHCTLLSDITVSTIIQSLNGEIVFTGNGHKMAYTVLQGANVTFNNVEFTSNLISTDSHVLLNNCKLDDTIQFNNSFGLLTSPDFAHDGTKINGKNSYLVINTPTGTSTATGLFINMEESFITGSFGIGAIGAGNKIVNHRGYTDFGRLVETDTILAGIFGQAGGPPFTYEKNTGKLRVMAADGTVYHIPT